MVNRLPLEEMVLSGLRPTAAEREHVCNLGKKLLEAIAGSGKAEGMVVGSIARHTWLRGDRDLDVFMLFDPSLPREALEAEGLALARSIAARFTGTYHEKYAEHPYINATIDDVDVDLVPCYNVSSAEKIQSAVDRTPFHTRYITDKINGLIDDVLLLKRFAKAGGIYGSDQMTEGFSGYLCELLVLNYGGFTGLLKAAAEWRPKTLIDPENHAKKEFDEPLIVIDPVDPRRNVAAAVSPDRMAEFVELARGYLESPSSDFFTLPASPCISQEELGALVTDRGTYLYAITFPTPPYIEEVIVPQLKRSTAGICEELERNGFSVHHAHYVMKPERCMFLFELLVAELPKVRTHSGPPLWNRTNADKFREKYISSVLPGPYISQARYEMEVPREYTRAKDLLNSPALQQVSLGKHVRQAFANGWHVDEGADCWHPEFADFIGSFFSRCSPFVRIRQKK
ncbi:CCA tRNA nucleotidyltransferase [uncultured Methanoregula sp.]|uniref:CCA tRNA nucleotidyltransferase n=1 Tax=uncultured Methanoregula sp. TaxID=1005933 RepID=UPI002AABC975|nr:CCA tRNA nucleotidyltransferase [uncultured Methanoregula sp.]